MQVLQNMDMNQFVIIVPAVLVAMYLLISFQKYLSERSNPYVGLIIPILCFVVATILSFRPLFVASMEYGLMALCLRMWITFNIPTLVLLFPYYRARKQQKATKSK